MRRLHRCAKPIHVHSLYSVSEVPVGVSQDRLRNAAYRRVPLPTDLRPALKDSMQAILTNGVKL